MQCPQETEDMASGLKALVTGFLAQCTFRVDALCSVVSVDRARGCGSFNLTQTSDNAYKSHIYSQ